MNRLRQHLVFHHVCDMLTRIFINYFVFGLQMQLVHCIVIFQNFLSVDSHLVFTHCY